MTQKFIDKDGLKVLWNQVNLKDYPNNETLMAVIDAIDETKANKDELFSKSWNDLEDKPTIPEKLSDLENDLYYSNKKEKVFEVAFSEFNKEQSPLNYYQIPEDIDMSWVTDEDTVDFEIMANTPGGTHIYTKASFVSKADIDDASFVLKYKDSSSTNVYVCVNSKLTADANPDYINLEKSETSCIIVFSGSPYLKTFSLFHVMDKKIPKECIELDKLSDLENDLYYYKQENVLSVNKSKFITYLSPLVHYTIPNSVDMSWLTDESMFDFEWNYFNQTTAAGIEERRTKENSTLTETLVIDEESFVLKYECDSMHILWICVNAKLTDDSNPNIIKFEKSDTSCIAAFTLSDFSIVLSKMLVRKIPKECIDADFDYTWAKLSDKPFGDIEVDPVTISFDNNYTESFFIGPWKMAKASGTVIDNVSSIIGGEVCYSDIMSDFIVAEEHITKDDNCIYIKDNQIAFVFNAYDNVSTGVYFLFNTAGRWNVSSFTTSGKETVYIDEKFIPDTIARKEDIKEQVQSDMNENDPSSSAYIQNRTHWKDENGEEVIYHQLDEKFIPNTIARVNQIPVVPTDMEILNLLAETDIIDVVADENGDIFTDSEGNFIVF